MDDPSRDGARPADETALPGLPAEKKVRLLSCRDFWATEELPQAGIRSLVLADGPHGLRHQPGSHDHLPVFAGEPATCSRPGSRSWATSTGACWTTSSGAAGTPPSA